MNTIIEQINNDVCEIILNKLDSNENNANKLLIFNSNDSVFDIKIRNYNFVLNISNNEYIEPKIHSPYIAKMLKVIKHDNKYFIFYEHMDNKVINLFTVKLTMEQCEKLKEEIINCMEAYKNAYDKDGYFTLDNVLYNPEQIALYTYVNNPDIKTFTNIIDETFIKLIILRVHPDNLYYYCEKLDPKFVSEHDKLGTYNMIDNAEHDWNNVLMSNFTYDTTISWIKKYDKISSLVKYLNEEHDFKFYYPSFWI